ncbi:GL27216 [Drosophila persimilis]|uniref:GL27216 n=1 Tax=Drosophila persimilis TaxID=7234 RepID=B4GYY1_DROPE|nr:GL27216 [Drosophila persimilis]
MLMNFTRCALGLTVVVVDVALPTAAFPQGTAELLFTGWGSQSVAGTLPVQLQRFQQQHITSQVCSTLLAAYEDVELGACHVCGFRQANIGACHGDSGGPLVYEGTLVGILNFFVPCAQGVPDLFMNIMYYRDWIRQTMSGNGKCSQVHKQQIG